MYSGGFCVCEKYDKLLILRDMFVKCCVNLVESNCVIKKSDCEWCLDRGIPLLSYRMCFFKVIPVAIGTDADSNELEKVTANRKNLVTSPKDEGPKSLGRKIMSAVIKGDVLLILLTDY